MLAFKIRTASAGAASEPFSCTFIGSHKSTSNATEYTFSSVSLGDAAASRYIVVGTGYYGGSSRTLSSVTIGGVSATIVKTQADSWTSYYTLAGLVIAAVPSGATGNVVVTWSGSANNCGIGIWRLTGLQSATPTATASYSADTSLSASLVIPSGGCGIGYSYNVTGTGTTTCSWTNLTENFDEVVEGSAIHSGAVSTTAGTANRTAAWTQKTVNALVLAAWN